jgi:hypothetical protein
VESLAEEGQVSTPPSYIYASTRSRRDVRARHGGTGTQLFLVVSVLLLFWAGLGVGAAVLFGAL